MADNTKIQWTDRTWNVVSGCTKISDGCMRCYIERTPPFRMAHRRFDKPGIGGTTGVTLHEDRLSHPLSWRKPARVFVCSLADLFHDAVQAQFIARVFAAMVASPEHTFQVLTKRHARMSMLLSDERFWQMVSAELSRLWRTDPPAPLRMVPPWIWVGVSVESQKWADVRIPALLKVPAAVRWLSCEPLVGPVDLTRWIGGADGCAAVSGSAGLRSGEVRRAADRPAGPDLAGERTSWSPLGAGDPRHPMHATAGGEPRREVPAGSGDDRRHAVVCDGAPAGVAALPWPNPRRADGQPQERHLDGQPAGQSGVGDVVRANGSRANGADARAVESVRRAQLDVEVDVRAGRGDSGSPGDRRAVGVDRSGLSSLHAADLPDCSGRPPISWLVCGGESGPNSRPMAEEWARSLVQQCQASGVAPFVKQMGAGWAREHDADAKGGDPAFWPTDLQVREYPTPRVEAVAA